MNGTLKIILGYALSFLYVGIVILIGELVQKKLNADKEITRKCEHLATGAVWIISYFCFGATYHLCILNGITLLVLAIATFGGFLSAVEREDMKKSYGLLFFGLSTFALSFPSVFINTDFYILSGIAYFALAFGDGLAPLVARLKHNIKMYNNKSVFGFLTVFAVSALCATVFNFAFGLGYSALFIISVGAVACLVELYSVYGTDNLSVILLTFGYLVLNYYGQAPFALQLALVLAVPLTIVNQLTGALTFVAGAFSLFYILLSAYFGGLAITVTIYVLYVIAGAAELVVHRISKIKRKHSARNTIQLLANGGLSMVFCILFFCFNRAYLIYTALAVLCEQFTDTIASTVGTLSPRPPLDIIRLKRIPSGISGGVSLIGTLAALFASAVAAAIPFAFDYRNWAVYLIIFAVGFGGNVIDSVLGSLAQALFRCTECNVLTEEEVHCGVRAEKVKGLRLVGNSTVNFLSGLFSAAVAFTVFILI